MSKFALLTQHIPELQNVNCGTAFDSTQSKAAGKEPFQMPCIEYPEAVERLHRDVFEFCDAHPEYEYTHYYNTLEENGLAWDFNLMSNADVSAFDAKAVIALLVGSFRAERFSDGVIMEFIENGSITRWLKRLKDLDEAESDTNSTVSN